MKRKVTVIFEMTVTLMTELEETSGLARTDAEFRSKAEALLGFYERVFGVDDLVERADEMLK